MKNILLKFRIFILLCQSLLFTVSSNIYSQVLKPVELYERVLPSVMTLNVIKSDGSEILGSAFLAMDEGIAVTAYHVIKDAIKITAKFSDGEEFDISGIIDKDEKRDIAIIRIKLFGKPSLELEKSEPKIGGEVYIIGAPLGLEFSITNGLLSQIQTFDGIKYYQFSCPASKGNSGCPLINAEGKVIGVVSFGVITGQNLNFAVPIIYVLGLDKTLPTQPFISNPINANLINFKNVSENQLVKELSTAVTIHLDFLSACEYLNETAYMDGNRYTFYYNQGFYEAGYNYPIPPFFYKYKEKINAQLRLLETIKSNDSQLDESRRLLINQMKDLIESADLLQEAIMIAKQRNGWEYKSNDLLSRAQAFGVDRDIYKDLLTTYLIDSTNIVTLLSDEVKDKLNLESSYPKFKLGVVFFNHKPNMIVLVRENGLAAKIELKVNDTLHELNGIRINGIAHFKKMLYEFRGRKIKLSVLREDSKEILNITLPNELNN